ncbi:MAG: PcfJ domain-containing protein [Burkholderiaceae bacterium]|nr:PcfJ domain-containing protein [Burkholderiaceae bacterium]
MRSFFNHLDREIIAQIDELERVSKLSVKRIGLKVRFTQLSTSNFFAAGDPIRRRNRLQAISEFPWIAPFVISKWQGVSTYPETTQFDSVSWGETLRKWGQPLREAIDSGRPLITEAARVFGVPKETIRWSVTRQLVFIAPFSFERVDALLRLISWIPPEMRPINEAEWRCLQSSLFYLVRIFNCCVDRGNDVNVQLNSRNDDAKLLAAPAMQEILKQRFKENVKMRFPERKSDQLLCQYLPRLPPFFKIDQWLCENLTDMHDFLATLGKARLARRTSFHKSLGAYVDDTPAFLKTWQSRLTLREIAVCSTKWHDELQIALNSEFALHEQRGIPNGKVLDEWPPILEEPFEFGSLRIVQLMNGEQLSKEGLVMQHCVGNYYADCLNGVSQIFSIRTNENSYLSTLHVQIGDQNNGRAATISHFGFKNSVPNDYCKKAAAGLIDLLNSPQYAKRLSDFIEFKAVDRAKQYENKSERREPQEIDRAKYDSIAVATAWRCAFPSENIALSFVERFYTNNQGSISPASFDDDYVALSKLLS